MRMCFEVAAGWVATVLLLPSLERKPEGLHGGGGRVVSVFLDLKIIAYVHPVSYPAGESERNGGQTSFRRTLT